jgi:Holliday junction resolvase
MSHPSKQKGNRFEREIVDKAKDIGLDSKRAWGSNGMALGEHPEVDCLINGYKIQAKVRKKLPKYLIPSKEVDAVVFKQDRGEILVLVRYEDWLQERKSNE